MRRNKLDEVSKKEQGFTLVEMLVVILIIGVLAAIAIPAFMNQRKKANDAALISDMRNMATAAETYLSIPGNAEKASKARHRIEIPTEQQGWIVVAVGSENDRFYGAVSATKSGAPDGFPEFRVSEGVGIGMSMQDAIVGSPGSFCLTGSMKNSNFDAKTEWVDVLYYDSVKGGLFEARELPPNGACKNYYNRVQNRI